MKKLTANLLFVIICIALCLVPLCGMLVKKTDTTTEKRTLAKWPSMTDADGSFNTDVLEEAGAYFNDHFALRNEMVSADSVLMSRVFRQSAVDTVFTGTDDWLYYTSTLDDYTGTNIVSERGAYQIAHNLRVVQDKMEQNGMTFMFVIAPNKNSLYDQNMPYYYRTKASDQNNLSRTMPYIGQQGVHYTDLYEVFRDQEEVLYRKQDSHWNAKGAVLAYNTILDTLGKAHNDFSDTDLIRTKTERGDLATALYSVAAKPEWNYRYDYESAFSYVTDTESWEDLWIQTENPEKNGTLLMFRDSFGDTLAPLMAEEYASGGFSKDSVYHLDSYIDMVQPDTVLFEIVERNIRRYGEFSKTEHSSGPPIMEAPTAQIDVSSAKAVESDTTVTAEVSDQQSDYLCVNGFVDKKYLDTETNVYAEITSADGSAVYEAYTVTNPETKQENGYLLYLNKEIFADSSFRIRIYTENTDQTLYTVADQEVSFE